MEKTQKIVFKEDENILIVSDRDYFYNLFNFKNKFSSLNIKIIDREELIDKLSFTLKKDPIPALLKMGYEYSKAKKYISLLRVANISKNKDLKNLYMNLKDEYFEEDEYGELELQSYDIYLFESDEDKELRSLLERNKFKYKNLHFDDLDIENNCFKPSKVTYFKDKYYQYSYIYSDIRRKLIEEPTLKDKIKILVSDDSDIFFVNMMSDIFKVESLAKINKSFLEYEDVKNKISSFYYSKRFSFEEAELENPRIKKLQDLINYYELEELDFTFAYANLLEIVSSLRETSYINNKGIRVDDKFKLDDSLVYITNFVQGSFYRIFDDKNVLSDDQLVKIDANPSYVLTSLDRRKKLNYLNHSNIALISRVKRHLKDNIYDSQFFDELKAKIDKEKKDDSLSNYVEEKDFNMDGLYTDEASKLFTSTKLDEKFYYGKNEEFNSYDHSYKKVTDRKLFEPKHYSITNLESYISCPFKYILNKIIPLKEQDLLYADIGTFVHAFLEDIDSEEFDFDVSFNRAKERFEENLKKNEKEITPKYSVELELLKNSLKVISPSIREMYQDVYLEKVVNEDGENDGSEQSISFNIDDVVDGKVVHYPFYGRIDKILISVSPTGKKFFSVIDYKTGKRVFDSKVLFLGKELQLPIYTYALLNTEKGRELVKNSDFGCFGYQRVLYKTPKELFGTENRDSTYSKEKMEKNINVQGFDCNEKDFHESLNLNDPHQVPLYKIPNRKSNTFVPLFERVLEDALLGTKKVIRNINNNEFPIKPTSSDLKGNESYLECKNCGYRDICFRTKKDFASYLDEINEHKSSLKEDK